MRLSFGPLGRLRSFSLSSARRTDLFSPLALVFLVFNRWRILRCQRIMNISLVFLNAGPAPLEPPYLAHGAAAEAEVVRGVHGRGPTTLLCPWLNGPSRTLGTGRTASKHKGIEKENE